jgi:hypothetical protein
VYCHSVTCYLSADFDWLKIANLSTDANLIFQPNEGVTAKARRKIPRAPFKSPFKIAPHFHSISLK